MKALNIKIGGLTCLYLTFFQVGLSQSLSSNLKPNELLCTKVQLTSKEHEEMFSEIIRQFQSNLMNDIGVNSIKYIDFHGFGEPIVLRLFTRLNLVLANFSFQDKPKLNFITYELNGVYFIMSPMVAQELGIQYTVIENDYVLKINNRELRKKFTKKDWKDVMIELKYFKDESKYQYLRYNFPKAS